MEGEEHSNTQQSDEPGQSTAGVQPSWCHDAVIPEWFAHRNVPAERSTVRDIKTILSFSKFNRIKASLTAGICFCMQENNLKLLLFRLCSHTDQLHFIAAKSTKKMARLVEDGFIWESQSWQIEVIYFLKVSLKIIFKNQEVQHMQQRSFLNPLITIQGPVTAQQ